MLDTSRGAKPLYIQVKETIVHSIKSGCWQVGEFIPTEKELMETFGVSRMTIRQATNELVGENLLIRKSGVGTKVREPVIDNSKFSTIVQSFSSETKEASRTPQTFYIKLHEIKPNEFLTGLFGEELKKNKKLFRLDRVRGYDGQKIVFFETFLCTNLDLSTMPMDSDFSLYKEFEKAGITLRLFEERISAKKADDRLSAFLDIQPEDAVLVRTRLAADQNGVFTEYSIGCYNASMYVYRINMK